MTSQSYWRRQAAPIVARIIAENRGLDEADLRKKIQAEYPFGPRRYHPYKIWLSEIKEQLAGRSVVVNVEEGKRLVFGSKMRPYGEGGSE